MGSAAPVLVEGLHHITLVASKERANKWFYTEVLGLRRVKLTVNQDDIFHRHIFYGDEAGASGSVVTFFEWPHLPRGVAGLGSPHHFAYTIRSLDSLHKWVSWLRRREVPVSGPHLFAGRASIYFRDPDGALVELTVQAEGDVKPDYLSEAFAEEVSVDKITPDMRVKLLDHVSPIASDPVVLERFLAKALGLRRVKRYENPHDRASVILCYGADDADFLRYIVKPSARPGFVGVGSIHHVAVKVGGEEEQRSVMEALDSMGVRHSGVIDRFWFKSLYFRDPFGNLLEVATEGPGYTADEPHESLGSRLALPPWLEKERKSIEASLRLLDEQYPARWPPICPPAPGRPERIG